MIYRDYTHSTFPDAHIVSDNHGWWDEAKTDGRLDKYKIISLLPQKLILISTEIAEAVEELRAGEFKTYEMLKVVIPGSTMPPMWMDARRLPVTALVQSRIGKPCGFPSEIADVVIRIDDLITALLVATEPGQQRDSSCKSTVSCSYQNQNLSFDYEVVSAGDIYSSLLYATYVLASTNLLVKSNKDYIDQVVYNLFRVRHIMFAIASNFDFENFDLSEELVRKSKFNETRSHRHGDKLF